MNKIEYVQENKTQKILWDFQKPTVKRPNLVFISKYWNFKLVDFAISAEDRMKVIEIKKTNARILSEKKNCGIWKGW